MNKLAKLAIVTLVFVCATTMNGVAGDLGGGNYTKTCLATVESGTLLGYNYDGTYTFLGVPYGQAKRFERATKVTPWKGVRYAMTPGEVSYQNQTNFNVRDLAAAVGKDMVMNENCLFLNIWTQSLNPSAKKPVIFFVHGGGLTTGGSNEMACYDGTNLSSFGDVVVVNFNHRLDIFGYLDLSAYGDKYKNSGNNSMTDIILALQWVKDNIKQFGGDPDNVTILGQSGGGTKIITLMGMTEAQGLFNKVDIHSGSGKTAAARTPEQAKAQTEDIFEYFGFSGPDKVEKLKSVSPYELLAAGAATRFVSSPVLDNELYPEPTVVNCKLTAVAKKAALPVMVSTVFGEMGSNIRFMSYANDGTGDFSRYFKPGMTQEKAMELIEAKYGTRSKAIVDAFRKAYPQHDIADVLWIAARTNDFATAVADAGASIWQSVYAYNYPIFGGVVAVHTGGDLPLLFRNMDLEKRLFVGDYDNAVKVSNYCSNALVQFAYTGNPTTKDLVFEQFTIKDGATMIYDVKPQIGYYHDRELMALIAGK